MGWLAIVHTCFGEDTHTEQREHNGITGMIRCGRSKKENVVVIIHRF